MGFVTAKPDSKHIIPSCIQCLTNKAVVETSSRHCPDGFPGLGPGRAKDQTVHPLWVDLDMIRYRIAGQSHHSIRCLQ